MRFVILILALLWSAGAAPAFATESSRLSAIVSLETHKPPMPEWLGNLDSDTYVEGWVRFPPQTGEDVIFGLDQEFIDGTKHPVFLKGGDWMGLVGVQRGGTVWVATGTDATMKGKPSGDVRNWKFIPLGATLQPDTWYRLRSVLNFKTRHYVSFRISGPGIDRTLDLSKFTVDYPNYIPFDKRTLSSYVWTIRSKALLKDPKSLAVAYFDDVSAGLTGPGGDKQVFFDDFEAAEGPIPKQDVSLFTLWRGLKVDKYVEGRWYLEREDALARALGAPFAHSGKKVAVCDATLESISYKDWYSRW